MNRPTPLVQGDALPDTGTYRPKPVFVDGLSDGGGAVDSVNGQTGAVVLDAEDVGALAEDYAPAWGDITDKPSTFPPSAHAATLVNVAADSTNGVAAGNAQVVISALAARIKALEDAAG